MNDERLFTQKLLESEPMLYRIACALLRSEADRRDAMQETALKAWQNCGKLREERYFRTWISRIMVNECHNLCRKNSRTVPMETLPDLPAPENGEQETRLMLESLPEKQRVPLVLHYLEGFSLEEILKIYTKKLKEEVIHYLLIYQKKLYLLLMECYNMIQKKD